MNLSENVALSATNISARLASVCRRFADKTALIDPSGRWSFGQLWRLSTATSTLVSTATKATNVGVMLPAVKEFAPVCFGSLMAGKCVVPVNFLLTPNEVEAVVADAGIDCIITTRAVTRRIGELDVSLIFIEDVAEQLMTAAQTEPSAELLKRAMSVPPETPAVIIYTTGISSDPKGVVLSHRNLLANTDSCVEALRLDENFTLLASLPFFHVFGLTAGLIMPIVFGATAVLLPKFSVPDLVASVRDHKVSIILTVPSMWTVLVKCGALVRGEFPTLQMCISGGEPLPLTTAQEFEQIMELPLLEGYGMTETSPVICLSRPDRRRKGSVGEPLPGVKVRIEGEDGMVRGANEEGEIQVKGPNVMQGYYDRPEMTARTMTSDGWLKTGDMGRLDADGFLYITGRIKDLIITGGQNVNPREVEEVLLTYPGVLEAAVVSVPNHSRGEVIGAFIVGTPGVSLEVAQVKKFCRQHLASYKVPRMIQFVSELPRKCAGKILKHRFLS